MPEQFGDKQHDATPHRRQQAREQGQVPRSVELTSSIVLIAALAALFASWESLRDFHARYLVEQLGGEAWIQTDVATVSQHARHVTLEVLKVMSPLIAVVFAVGLGVNLAQVGLHFLPEKIAPDLQRLDPISGLQRMFSLENFVKLGLSLLKLGLVAAVAYVAVADQLDEICGLTALSTMQVGSFLLDLLFWTSLKIALAMLTLALIDYAFHWWKNEQDLRMTTHELREEMKDLVGNPQIIAHRRSVQRQLVMQRTSTSVPKASVVITNPTELAVAIQYEPDTMEAPVVVAKGAGVLAGRIRQLALQHGIPIVEKKPLAQLLYREVDIGKPIPQQSYAAVAEVLAYVYQLKGKQPPNIRPGRASA